MKKCWGNHSPCLHGLWNHAYQTSIWP
jgi:hypothetical protein